MPQKGTPFPFWMHLRKKKERRTFLLTGAVGFEVFEFYAEFAGLAGDRQKGKSGDPAIAVFHRAIAHLHLQIRDTKTLIDRAG